jgi:serine/threonine-protein kinase
VSPAASAERDAARAEPVFIELPGTRPGTRGATVALVPDPAGARHLVQVTQAADVAELSMAIAHPHLLSLRAIGDTDDGPVLLSDYVAGVTLAELLQLAVARRIPVPTAVAVRIVLDLCAGVAALHERGRAHGAVCPQRVTIGEDGVARLCDPRIVQRQRQRPRRRTPQLAYTAPELLDGDTPRPEADVFSLGVIAWEVLARRRLFRADRDSEAARRVLAEQPPRLSAVMPHLGRQLDNVIAKALTKDRLGRYDDVHGFAVALQTLAARRRWLAAHADVAKLVRTLAGQTLAARREALEHLVRGTLTQERTGSPEHAGIEEVTGVLDEVPLATKIGASVSGLWPRARRPPADRRSAQAQPTQETAPPHEAAEQSGVRSRLPTSTLGRSLLLSAIALSPASLVLLAWAVWLVVQPADDRRSEVTWPEIAAPAAAPVASVAAGMPPTPARAPRAGAARGPVRVVPIADVGAATTAPVTRAPARAAAARAAPAPPAARPAPATTAAERPAASAAKISPSSEPAAARSMQSAAPTRPERAERRAAAQPSRKTDRPSSDLPSNPYGS